MRGAIEQRSPGAWSVRVDLPRLADGRRRQRRITVRGSRREAEAAAAKLILEVHAGAHGSTGVLAGALFERWLESRAPLVEEKTLDRYRSLVEIYLKPTFGGITAREITTGMIEQARHDWLVGSRHDGKRGQLSRRSVQHTMDTLRASLRWARRIGLLANDPFSAVEPMTVHEAEQRSLSVGQLEDFLRCLSVSDLLLPVIVDVGTGLRRGELLGLKWHDVDLILAQIQIERALKRIAGLPTYRPLKSRRSRRTVPIPDFCVAALRQQYAEQKERFRLLEIVQTQETAVFDHLGVPWDPEAFSLNFYRTIRRTGAPVVRLHDLRHSFTSLGLQAGTALRILSDLLGHSSYSITADRYAHVSTALHRDAANRLQHLVGPHVAALTS